MINEQATTRIFLDNVNETDVNSEIFILFTVTGLLNWFQGLLNLEYRKRRYTVSLVIGCHVDQEALVSFLHLTSEDCYRPREAPIFAEGVYDCFYNDYSVVAALANKGECFIKAGLRINDEQQAFDIYVLGVAFNVTEVREDESSTDDSSASSSYSSGSGSVESDREERIARLLEYLRDYSSGHSSF